MCTNLTINDADVPACILCAASNVQIPLAQISHRAKHMQNINKYHMNANAEKMEEEEENKKTHTHTAHQHLPERCLCDCNVQYRRMIDSFARFSTTLIQIQFTCEFIRFSGCAATSAVNSKSFLVRLHAS